MSYTQDRPSSFSGLRIILWCTLALAVIVPGFLLWSILPDLSDPSDAFYQRKGSLESIDIESEWQQGNSVFRHITLQSDSGLKVKMTTRFPLESSAQDSTAQGRTAQGRTAQDRTAQDRTAQDRTAQGRTSQGHPLVLILGGKRTGRDAVHQVSQQLPIALAALSYPGLDNWVTEGVKRYDVRQYQQTERDTVPAVLLALDYLLAQPSVDKQQVELVGVSLGAFFVSMPAALDKRVTRTWLVHGAGEPEKVIAHRLQGRIESDVLRSLVAWASARLLAVETFRPENWLSRISPRKLVFINASDDEQLPLASVQALHRSASQPYEVIWTEGQHIDTGRDEVVQDLVNLVMDRVQSSSQD